VLQYEGRAGGVWGRGLVNETREIVDILPLPGLRHFDGSRVLSPAWSPRVSQVKCACSQYIVSRPIYCLLIRSKKILNPAF
jgi:hypothetical protein